MTAYSIPSEFLNQNPNSKATFRPGGDAQYVSYLLGGLINWIADYNFGGKDATDKDFQREYLVVARAEMSNLGFSDSLALKFQAAADRILAREVAGAEKRIDKAAKKAAAKAAKPAKRELIEVIDAGTVKVGRWEYPARELKFNDDTHTLQRNKNRDGSGEWIDMLDGKDAPSA